MLEKIGKIIGILAFIAAFGSWFVATYPTKADLQRVAHEGTQQYLEIRITQAESSLATLDEASDSGTVLTAKQTRRYSELSALKLRLTAEKDRRNTPE